MENLDFILSLFNQYCFNDAKNNIESLEYYVSVNPAISGNTLITNLLGAIKNYSFESIDLPLFQSILMKDRKTPQEQQQIIGDLMKWKSYGKQQMIPTKKYLEDIIAGSIIARANSKFSDDPMGYLNYLKQSNVKLDRTESLNSQSFDKVDINSIVASGTNQRFSSYFDWVNEQFEPYRQVEFGQMLIVSAPPGCMSGDTEVFLADGGVKSLEDLYERNNKDIKIFSYGQEGYSVAEAERVAWSKCVYTWYVFTIDGKEFRATDDHPLLLSSGEWKQAKDLKAGDLLRGVDFSTGTEIDLEVTDVREEYNKIAKRVYDVVNAGKDHNYAVKVKDNIGFFSHNTGKTLWMMTEAFNMAVTTQYKVLYVSMGDMNMKDFIVRLGAIHSGKPFGEVSRDLGSVYESLKKMTGDRLDISINPAGTVKVEELVDYVLARGYNAVFIDYDSNFYMKSSGSMYLDYGDIYNELTRLTLEGVFVEIGSQPHKQVWDKEEFGLEMLGESSRKGHTTDMAITLGKIQGNNHCGLVTFAKNRRGEVGDVMGYVRLGNGRFRIVPRDVASSIAQRPKQFLLDSDIDEVLRYHSSTSYAMGGGGISKHPKIANPFK